MTVVARAFGVDERLEAGMVALAGGGAMLGEFVLSGVLMLVCGAALVALSDGSSRVRGTGA